MNDGIIPARPASYDKKVGLVLQGGGALGSYQGGVYEALAASEYLPDWVAGISIGAINAAVIAGNAPEHRVQRLRSFWEEITASTSLWHSAADGPIVEWQQWAGAFTALMFGQPGFFEPRRKRRNPQARPDCRRAGVGLCDTLWLVEQLRHRTRWHRGDQPRTDCDQASASRDPAYEVFGQSPAGHVEIVDAFRLQWSAEAEAQDGGAGFEIGFIVVLE